MKILLTGYHGFIATHLRKKLRSNPDNKIYLLDRKFLYQPEVLKQVIKNISPDQIYHLAAYGNHYFQTEEDLVYTANVEVLFNLLDAIKDLKFSYMANFATTYHNMESGSPYGSTKAAGEYLVRLYVAKYNLPIVNIRPYSIYGEHEWDFRFIPTISRQISKGQEITVSDVKHDWTYVEDFITGLLKTINFINVLKGKSVGIGSGKRRSNLEVAKTLMKVAKRKVKINDGIKRSYEIAAYSKKMMLSKDKDEVFFKEDSTSLETGLKRVYDAPYLQLKYGK